MQTLFSAIRAATTFGNERLRLVFTFTSPFQVGTPLWSFILFAKLGLINGATATALPVLAHLSGVVSLLSAVHRSRGRAMVTRAPSKSSFAKKMGSIAPHRAVQARPSNDSPGSDWKIEAWPRAMDSSVWIELIDRFGAYGSWLAGWASTGLNRAARYSASAHFAQLGLEDWWLGRGLNREH